MIGHPGDWRRREPIERYRVMAQFAARLKSLDLCGIILYSIEVL
jgi:hypothetical protein